MIKLVVLDVDGCLSDGGIIYSSELVEYKKFNVKDGFAIVHSKKLGLEFAIITGRDSTIVKHRAKELGIAHLYQGVKDKLQVLKTLCLELDITLDEVAAIGDDLNDLKLLNSVGISFCPKDATTYVAKEVDVVLSKNGGDAVVREMIEIVLAKNNQLENFLAPWR